MATLFGSIQVETPPFQLLRRTNVYEIRRYAPQLRCTVFNRATGSGSGLTAGEGFRDLAGYIFGDNEKVSGNESGSDKIAMTAPVLTQQQSEKSSTKIAMTAPVITQQQSNESAKIAMTAPVVTSSASEQDGNSVTMSFILPSQYQRLEQLPRPRNPRVQLEQIPEKTWAVHRFSGRATDSIVQEKFTMLKQELARDKITIVPGAEVLARYNPPWTLPFLRTNEVQVQVEYQTDQAE